MKAVSEANVTRDPQICTTCIMDGSVPDIEFGDAVIGKLCDEHNRLAQIYVHNDANG